MVGRPYQICQGVNVSAELREQYLAQWSKTPPAKKPAPLPCVHQGLAVESRLCTTCTGQVAIKVFACELHGLCSVKKDVGVKVCAVCSDRCPEMQAEDPPEDPRRIT